MENQQPVSLANTASALYDGAVWFFQNLIFAALLHWLRSCKSWPVVGLELEKKSISVGSCIMAGPLSFLCHILLVI